MAVPQTIDAPIPSDDSADGVLARYGHLVGRAFEAAVRYEAMPPGTPLDIATIRKLIDVGAHVAARVLRELIEGGLAGARRLRDAATGRMIGRRTDWTGPRQADSTTAEAVPARASDPAVEALALLRSLADVDARLTFRDRDLRTLVPFVLDRLATGDTPADLRRELTGDLPARGRPIRTGLLYYRLTKAPRPPTAAPTQPLAPRLIECADCGRPNRALTPGSLCRDCRPATNPQPLTTTPSRPT
ncbi:hypothetical protein [Embleya sp. NBC_00896]|uniref:hypothetical protein n=1 Tax=Embleya sp. NBC_00896 TaxID=2975961 RepID=UPI0038688B29|nr:hypothetical protein OG928_14710 [Embleya sp. NBC_00896]